MGTITIIKDGVICSPRNRTLNSEKAKCVHIKCKEKVLQVAENVPNKIIRYILHKSYTVMNLFNMLSRWGTVGCFSVHLPVLISFSFEMVLQQLSQRLMCHCCLPAGQKNVTTETTIA